MILRFLRLFPEFRAVESMMVDWREKFMAATASLEAIAHDEVEFQNTLRTVVELQHENSKLIDRVDALLEDRTALWASFQESLRSERASYQLGINSAVQRMNGGIPYPDAPHLAVQATQEPGESTSLGRQGRISSSDRLNEATNAYIQSKIARS